MTNSNETTHAPAFTTSEHFVANAMAAAIHWTRGLFPEVLRGYVTDLIHDGVAVASLSPGQKFRWILLESGTAIGEEDSDIIRYWRGKGLAEFEMTCVLDKPQVVVSIRLVSRRQDSPPVVTVGNDDAYLDAAERTSIMESWDDPDSAQVVNLKG